jgi:PIN domain
VNCVKCADGFHRKRAPRAIASLYSENYGYGIFESEARLRLRGRDEDDWPVLATALALACGVWNTNRIEIFLQEQANSVESQE